MQASGEAKPPPAAMTAAMMAERASLMFALDAPGPVASGMPKIAVSATMGLVELAFEAIGKLCDKHGKAFSKAYSNFDRVVGLGWLVADALGAPLLTRERAYTVGLKLRKLPGELKVDRLAVRKAASRAISKLKAADPRRLELKQKADDDEAQLACAEVDVNLPTSAPDPPARASGSRKCADRKPEDSLDSRVAAAADAVLAAQKALKTAERRHDSARMNVRAKEKQVARVWRRVESSMKPDKKSFKQLQRCSHWLRMHGQVERVLHDAELVERNRLIEYLQAQIDLRDAWMDEKDVDMDVYMAEMDAAWALDGSE